MLFLFVNYNCDILTLIFFCNYNGNLYNNFLFFYLLIIKIINVVDNRIEQCVFFNM
jgi:hypothetical protein